MVGTETGSSNARHGHPATGHSATAWVCMRGFSGHHRSAILLDLLGRKCVATSQGVREGSVCANGNAGLMWQSSFTLSHRSWSI
jgi:hypothetical protein